VIEAFEGLVEIVRPEIVAEALGGQKEAEQGYRCVGEEGQIFAPARLGIQSILRDRMQKIGRGLDRRSGWAKSWWVYV
jgi:hypothetical protein